MRKICILMAIALACALVPGAGAEPKASARSESLPASDQLSFYRTVTSNEMAALLREMDLDIVTTSPLDGGRVQVDIVMDAVDKAHAESLGLTFEVLRSHETSSRDESRATAGYNVWQQYLGAGGIVEELQQTVADHPAITKLVSIGKSVNGTDIYAVKVTKDARKIRDGKRPAVLYSALQHAREWISGEVNTRLLAYFTDNYATDPAVRSIVDSTELWFLPVSNPDGYDFTFTPGNRLWRKNLRDNNGDGVITAGDGVDLNRNFPTDWQMDDEGSSPNPFNETYRGAAPASEPETRAFDGLLRNIGFEMMVNYHSVAELILYPHGNQLYTTTADNPIYEALAGDDANPAIEGFDPDLAAELYTTNGDTIEHAHGRYGTIAFTPELSDGGCDECGFEFPDDEAAVQHEFEINLPFALDVALSAGHPTEPSSHLGNTTPDFVLDPFSVSYGDSQEVQVTAKRSLGSVKLHYSINGHKEKRVETREWRGGERYGKGFDTYYHVMRGEVRGAKPGDEVTVRFSGDRKPGFSDSFTYTLASDTRSEILVVAAEDYSGLSPAQGPGPHYLQYYVDAIKASRFGKKGVDVYDVDANGRTAPHPLGVLSHYDAVVWYTGDDLITRAPGQVPGTTAKLTQELEVAMRDYLNEGGKVFYSGQDAGFAHGANGAYYYNPFVPDQAECTAQEYPCIPLFNDFLQYYLGAYNYTASAGIDPDTGNVFDVVGEQDNKFEGASYSFNGPDSAQNQGDAASFLTTSSFLPADEFPNFSSEPALTYVRPGGAPFEPLSGDFYVASQQADVSYKRLSQTIDLTDATTGALNFNVSYDTEPAWDFLFVEAHTVGEDDWTTLEVPGLTSDATGDSCGGGWHEIHPFLAHYQTDNGDGTCSPTGSSGAWNATSGSSGGWEEWHADLSSFAGEQVEVSITYVSDWAIQGLGVFVDDVSTVVDGVASETSFETDLGGWSVPGSADGSAANPTDWIRSEKLFDEGAGVITDDSVYLGFGLEGVTGADRRADLMRRVLDHLLRT